MDHSRISRIFRLLTALGSGRPYTVDDIAKMFSIARRTVFRDLKLLQTIGVPYFYDHKNRCYKVEPDFSFSCPNLSRQEALALLLLVKMAKNVNLPFKSSLLQAAIKIKSNLPEETRRYCITTLENITIETFPQVKTPQLNTLFAQLTKTIAKRQAVEIRYYMPCEQRRETIQLDPYRLTFSENNWCVIGKLSVDNAIGTFRFNHIKALKPICRFFFKDDKFGVDEYLGRAWSMEPEYKLYNVKLRFAPEIAPEVSATQWHCTQTATHQADSSAVIEFRVDGLNEIKWWILSYGDRVQVLEPKVLREIITAIAEKVVKLNQ